MSKKTLPDATAAWAGFEPGLWQKEINVRAFIQRNVAPYDGDSAFLAGATARTTKIWERLKELFIEERKKGVLDVSQIPSSITAHGPICVNLRTVASFCGGYSRAIH